jgi:hypothetical protein
MVSVYKEPIEFLTSIGPDWFKCGRSILVGGDMDISNRSLTSLPDLSRVEIEGSFYCNGNQLTSLKGAPKQVGKHFNCMSNLLISLDGPVCQYRLIHLTTLNNISPGRRNDSLLHGFC